VLKHGAASTVHGLYERIRRFVTERPRWLVALLATALHAVLYLLPNHVQWVPPRVLPLSSLDQWLPLIPETVWIYWSDYLLLFCGFHFCRSPEAVWRFSVAIFATVVAGVAVHWLFPVVYPRSLYPLPGDASVTLFLFERFRAVDTPASSLPSLHVAASYVAALMAPRGARGRRILLLVWATAIAASTLTTKQHYVVDVAAGLALAGAVFAMSQRFGSASESRR
jgi:membrane-associated phospholipid phosphatase